MRQRAIEKRARARAGEALAERDQQFALGRKWRHERSEALPRPYANAARDLLHLLDRLTFEDVGRLVPQVRVRNGLPPFDDSPPWSDEPLSVFLILREVLT